MATWHEYLIDEGRPPAWPYPVHFGQEQEIDTDVLVIGGGIAGCWAAISAARQGVRVTLVEKGDVRRSGAGGPGCDHWCNVPANPLSREDPDEWASHRAERPYGNGIGIQIQCRENFDTLLEMEQMGGKIRDSEDEYVGAEGRDEKTKFMISPRTFQPAPAVIEPGFNPPEKRNNIVMRIWGNTFKPVLKKECLRLGVKVFDRVMGTSLLNENGVQGARVVGATGLNGRTGEFMIFRAKAVILSAGDNGSLWLMSMEHGGYSSMHPRANSGDGTAMAWKAGAALTVMEKSSVLSIATGLKHKWYTGAGDASYENVQLIDANGRKLPYPTQGWADAGATLLPGVEEKVRKGIMTGEYELPFYGDFPAMPEVERRTTFNMMLGQESTTRIFVDTMTKGGFDIGADLLMSYKYIEGQSPPQWREISHGGGLVVDWDLKTTVEGLYAAGTEMFTAEDHSFCAATGRYAGRKAAAYIRNVGDDQRIDRGQIEQEKNRLFAPTKRTSGIEWKELHNGLTRAMQYFVSEFKTERLLKMGLEEIERLEAEAVPRLFALDPHKLMRTIEDLSMIEQAKVVIHASLARKASSAVLGFNRIDYPEVDPPEWNKYLTLKLENNRVQTGEMPPRYWGDLVQQYETHNRDYTGVYEPKS